MKKDTIFTFFFELQNNVKLFHWLTDSYAKHKATDQLYDDLNKTIDKFIEVYIGKYGRLQNVNRELKLIKYSDADFVNYLKRTIKYLEGDFIGLISKNDSDLITLRDDLLIQINQALYLLSLK